MYSCVVHPHAAEHSVAGGLVSVAPALASEDLGVVELVAAEPVVAELAAVELAAVVDTSAGVPAKVVADAAAAGPHLYAGAVVVHAAPL